MSATLGKFAYNHAMKRLFLLTLLIQLTFIVAVILVSNTWRNARTPVVAQVQVELQLTDSGWCWQRLCPGKTVFVKTKAQLEALGKYAVTELTIGETILQWKSYTDPAWYGTISPSSDDKFIYLVHINLEDKDLRLGDAIAQFGRPNFASTAFMMSQKKNALILVTFICFEGGLCFTVEPKHCTPQMQFDVYMPIRHVILYPAARLRTQFVEASEWQAINRQTMRCTAYTY